MPSASCFGRRLRQRRSWYPRRRRRRITRASAAHAPSLLFWKSLTSPHRTVCTATGTCSHNPGEDSAPDWASAVLDPRPRSRAEWGVWSKRDSEGVPSKETCEGVREAGKCGSGGARLHMFPGKLCSMKAPGSGCGILSASRRGCWTLCLHTW